MDSRQVATQGFSFPLSPVALAVQGFIASLVAGSLPGGRRGVATQRIVIGSADRAVVAGADRPEIAADDRPVAAGAGRVVCSGGGRSRQRGTVRSKS